MIIQISGLSLSDSLNMDYFPFCRCLTCAGCNEEKRTGARRLDWEGKEADFVNFCDNGTIIIDAEMLTSLPSHL